MMIWWNRFLFIWVMLMFSVSPSRQAMAGQVQMPVRSHSIEIKSNLNRILELRSENSEEMTRSSVALEGLERTLTALQPSLIMGFSQLTKETPLLTSQVSFFLEIQKKILATNPRCKFSVTLYVSNYLTAPELLAKLQEITTKLKPDIINMALSSSNEIVSPGALARGIEYAHAHGQLVTYEGPMNMIPDGIDGFVMKVTNGEVKRDEINNFKMKHHLPIIMQVRFMIHDHNQKEMLLLSHLAEEQASFGYHLAYPLQLKSSGKLSENKDASLLVMLRALMTRYN